MKEGRSQRGRMERDFSSGDLRIGLFELLENGSRLIERQSRGGIDVETREANAGFDHEELVIGINVVLEMIENRLRRSLVRDYPCGFERLVAVVREFLDALRDAGVVLLWCL